MGKNRNRVNAIQMTELCRAVEAVPELWHIARALCTEVENLRAELDVSPDHEAAMRSRDKFVSSLHTTAGRLDALKHVGSLVEARLSPHEACAEALQALRADLLLAQERTLKGVRLSQPEGG